MNEQARGAAAATVSFLIWAMSPLYWKLLVSIPSLELVAHRILWSLPLAWGGLWLIGGLKGAKKHLRSPKTVAILAITATLVGGNWLLFIWAVNTGHTLDASLGYYIGPLVNVLLGSLLLGEKLRPAQWFAVAIAGIGVSILVLAQSGSLWISLTLAGSFCIYGLVRKQLPVDALEGQGIELIVLSTPALAYLAFLETQGNSAFLDQGLGLDGILACAGVITFTPLFLFNFGARRIYLSTLGILQFIAPTGQFLLAVFAFGEVFTPAHGKAFPLIWLALILYSVDSFRAIRPVVQEN